MPCGPLQSMQIVALASGNIFTGAFSMFCFSLGTVPLMLGFGSVVSALGKHFTRPGIKSRSDSCSSNGFIYDDAGNFIVGT